MMKDGLMQRHAIKRWVSMCEDSSASQRWRASRAVATITQQSMPLNYAVKRYGTRDA
jgi:hypothetical protein